MANKKISELAALALLADDDVLPIDDISATETKKVSIATLKTVLSAWRAINATVATAASNITLDVNVGVYKVDTAAPRSLTLYAPGTATGKLPFLLIGDGSDVNAITLVRAGSEKIDSVAASRVLSAKYGRWLVYTDGTDWFTLDVSSGLTAADVLAALAAATSAVNVNGQKIANVSDPGSAQDAATKAYVDAVAQGLSAKKSVRVATTAAGTLATSFENGDTVDGVVLATGDRILIKNQAAGGENGVYTVNASGAPTRATDFDTAAKIEVGAYFFVEEGTTNANSGWVLTTDGAIVVGTTVLAFQQFSGAGQITAGAGLLKSGNTLFADHGAGITSVGRANNDGASGQVARVDHVHDGGVMYPVRKTASFSIAATEGVCLVDTSAGDVEITLPAVAQRRFSVKKITTDSNRIILAPNGSDGIEGRSRKYMLPGSDLRERGEWDVYGSTQASATGWWVRGTRGNADNLDLASGGTFARALEGSYQTGAATIAWAASGERRMEDRGDGYGPCLLMEPARTNALLRSEEFGNASWTKTGGTTVTDDTQAAPDGTVDADSVIFTASATDEISQTFTSADSDRACFSVWLRAAAPQTVRITILKRDGTELAAVSCSVTTTWQRFQVVGSLATGATTAKAIIRNHSDAAARTVFAWGAQVEVGANIVTASSYIRTTTAAVTRPADTLSYAAGDFPAEFRTRGLMVDAIPEISSTDLPTHANAMMAASFTGASTTWIALTYGPASFYTLLNGASVTASATWAARAFLRMALRAFAGQADFAGGLTGNTPSSQQATSLILSTTGALFIGIRADTGNQHWFGRLGRFVQSPP